MILGAPHIRTGSVFTYVEVVELRAPGRWAGQIKTPRLHNVVIHGPHDALGIGVGAAAQVERLVLGGVNGVPLISGEAGFSSGQSRRRTPSARRACPCRAARNGGCAARTDPEEAAWAAPDAERR